MIGPLLILVLYSSHEHLNVVNEGKLHEGTEDESETNNDVDVHGGGVRDLWFVIPNKSNSNHRCDMVSWLFFHFKNVI